MLLEFKVQNVCFQIINELRKEFGNTLMIIEFQITEYKMYGIFQNLKPTAK